MDIINGAEPETKPAVETHELAWLKTKSAKVSLIVVVVLLVCAGLVYYFRSLFVAAIVDGHPITRVSIIKQLEKQNGQAALDSAIDQQLIADAEQAAHVTVSDADVAAELKKVEDSVAAQGQTLAAALTAQNLTEEDLKTQIITELKLEKLLGDKIAPTDDEINQYIKQNNITIPAGQDAAIKAQISEQVRESKISAAAQDLLTQLRAKAKIETFVNY